VYVTVAGPGQNGLSSNPITDAPSAGLIRNSTLGSTVPMRLSWCGVTRAGASVRSYRVDQSTNSGATYATQLFSATTAKSSNRSLKLGTTYRWRARTTDSAGRTGAYAASLTTSLGRFQDTNAALTYSTGWSTRSTSDASGGTMRYASSSAAWARLTVASVRQVGIVGPKGSSMGSVQVYIDGTLVATVSERASSTVYRRMLYVRSLDPAVSHTIELRPAGNGRIYLDAIVTVQ
jgi:hypothetical protein